MLKRCDACGELLRPGDKVRAVVISTYVELPSKIAYAIDKPQSCEEIMHENCFDVD